MLSRQSKRAFYKFFGLFAVVRGYNILLIVIAQYLASIFVLAPEMPISKIIFDDRLFMLVLSSSLAIAGGYIINSFYDFEKDIINKPLTSMINRLISQNTKLVGYFILNFLSVIVAGYVSFKATLFFSAYIFGLWIYSHRLKKIPFVGNIISASLAITPFFAIFLYFHGSYPVVFVHASLLFLLILLKEQLKDLSNVPGDLVHNYQTVPVKYGEKTAKIWVAFTSLLALILVYYMYFELPEIGKMKYYLTIVFAFLIIVLATIGFCSKLKYYKRLQLLIKILLVLGLFSVILIDY